MNEIEELNDSTYIIGAHYKDSFYEPLKIMEDWFSTDEYIGFLKGCVLKRLKRWKVEHGDRDLKKMKLEIEELISFVNNKTGVL